MTVSELISTLSTLPPDSTVCIDDEDLEGNFSLIPINRAVIEYARATKNPWKMKFSEKGKEVVVLR